MILIKDLTMEDKNGKTRDNTAWGVLPKIGMGDEKALGERAYVDSIYWWIFRLWRIQGHSRMLNGIKIQSKQIEFAELLHAQ